MAFHNDYSKTEEGVAKGTVRNYHKQMTQLAVVSSRNGA